MYESSGLQFFRSTTGIQLGPNTFDEFSVVITFLTILELTEILCSFRLVLEGRTDKEIPESSRLKFLEKKLAKNFVLSDAEDSTSWPLNRGGIADLPLVSTIYSICRKSRESSFWEFINSFVLLTYATLTASKTLLQRLQACLKLTLDSEDLLCWYKRRNDFYELWQQHEGLKTVEMTEAGLDTYNEGYIHQYQPEPLHEIN